MNIKRVNGIVCTITAFLKVHKVKDSFKRNYWITIRQSHLFRMNVKISILTNILLLCQAKKEQTKNQMQERHKHKKFLKKIILMNTFLIQNQFFQWWYNSQVSLCITSDSISQLCQFLMLSSLITSKPSDISITTDS